MESLPFFCCCSCCFFWLDPHPLLCRLRFRPACPSDASHQRTPCLRLRRSVFTLRRLGRICPARQSGHLGGWASAHAPKSGPASRLRRPLLLSPLFCLACTTLITMSIWLPQKPETCIDKRRLISIVLAPVLGLPQVHAVSPCRFCALIALDITAQYYGTKYTAPRLTYCMHLVRGCWSLFAGSSNAQTGFTSRYG